MERERNARKRGIRLNPPTRLRSPYPWMSYPEAIVQQDLERRGVPFAWRKFDGDVSSAPDFIYLMPDYSPTFVLREYKVAIFVIQPFFGTIPGVLDKVGLAVALLEADHWKAVLIYQQDVYEGRVASEIDRQAPELAHPTVRGTERVDQRQQEYYATKRRLRLFQQSRRGRFMSAALKESTHARHNRHPVSRSNSGSGRQRVLGGRRRGKSSADTERVDGG